ncbi:Leucine-Rich Repeats And Immunoglobulin-Like Domains Protein 3 [Manis pentadactyla]|nr:Leucine-Rich Repeats And Immunoglobulin-Like Domains Protein 3 [Manis pentadactyla]
MREAAAHLIGNKIVIMWSLTSSTHPLHLHHEKALKTLDLAIHDLQTLFTSHPALICDPSACKKSLELKYIQADSPN